ncbi:MAG: MFS transporter [Alphaproteobacteria bacterium]
MTFFKHVPIVILALTFAAFGISTGEFVIPGLLVQIAQDFNVATDSAGLLVSAYAAGVVIGGPLVAAISLKFNRKKVLLVLLSIFLAGNVLCAVSASYSLLLAARIITALCPGAFFGFATVVATELAEPAYRTRAVALVFIGTTLANMLGVPLGTALGYFFNWRAVFWIVAGITACAVATIIVKLPDSKKIERMFKITGEFIVFKRPTVLVSFLLSALLNGGFFIVYTYISPLLTQILGIPAASVGLVLFMLSIALPAGTFIGGKLGDKNQTKALIGLFSCLIGLLLLLFIVMPATYISLLILFIWNTLVFTTTPILQTMAIENAFEAPHLSSTFNQSAFNIGVVAASAGGSILLHTGMPLELLPIVGILFLSVGLGLVFVYKRLKRV